jgi:hypothetical protein
MQLSFSSKSPTKMFDFQNFEFSQKSINQLASGVHLHNPTPPNPHR